MNRKLLDPFQAVELPEVIEEYLEHGTAQCLAFNRRGTLLASGTKEGEVAIWDFDTRGIATVIKAHSAPVTSLQWSRNGRHLLTGSEDKSIALWHVEDGTEVCRLQMPSAVTQVSLTPCEPYRCVASLVDDAPQLVNLATQEVEPLPLPAEGDAAAKPRAEGGAAPGPGSSAVALFSKDAEYIVVGQSKGMLTVVDAAGKGVLDIVRVPNSCRITGLALNRKGGLLLATCQDQRVRLYEALPRAACPALEPASEQRVREALVSSKGIKAGSLLAPEASAGLLRPLREFQNAVERTPWRAATFSCDSEHVVGAIAHKAQHQLYIWNRPLGNMERILDGPKEAITDLVWHPVRSLLLSCSSTGRIYIWAKVYAENWSSFAPDFRELVENVEYVEREDEFDWQTPGAGGELGGRALDGAGAAAAAGGSGDAGGQQQDADEDAPLDILTREPELLLSSDDEEELRQELRYLPVVVEPEPQPVHVAQPDDAAVPAGPDAPTADAANGTTDAEAPDGEGTTPGAGGEGDAWPPDGEGDADMYDAYEEVKQEGQEENGGEFEDPGAAPGGSRKRKVQFGDASDADRS